MSTKFTAVIAAGMIVALMLTGCSLKSGLPSYDSAGTKTEARDPDTVVKDTVQQLANENHVKPTLSDSFVSQYLDVASLDELKQRVKDGMAATQDKAGMTEQQISLWQEMMNEKSFPEYTTDDVNARITELNGVLDDLAEEHKISKEDLVGQGGMTMDESVDFIRKQAEKYYESDSEVAKKMGIDPADLSDGNGDASKTKDNQDIGLDDNTIRALSEKSSDS